MAVVLNWEIGQLSPLSASVTHSLLKRKAFGATVRPVGRTVVVKGSSPLGLFMKSDDT